MLKEKFEYKISLYGGLSLSEAREKWSGYLENNPKLVKGGVFTEYRVENGRFKMYYHTDYRKDFCDTMFDGELFANDGECQLHGAVKATPTVKLIAVLIFVISVIIGVLLVLFPLFDYPIVIILIGAAMALFTARASKAKAARIEEEIQKFINT